MKILHVYRGYGKTLKNPVIDNQLDSLMMLKTKNFEFINFILAKGGLNYLKEIVNLHRFIRDNHIDIIHAHYSYSGFLAGVSSIKRPVICSLMGSDVYAKKYMKKLITFFIKKVWANTIVKSSEMKKIFKNTLVIPNGVDVDNFSLKPINDAFKYTRFNPKIKNIIFIATNPYSNVKNLTLAKEAIEIVKRGIYSNVHLHLLSNVNFSDLPYFYSAADLLLLTSKSEGSPNVIKEAMACNCPIVSTDVGDVREIIEGVLGCYTTTFEAKDVAEKIIKAIKFGKRTKGRKNIGRMDNRIIAQKIIDVYKSCSK